MFHSCCLQPVDCVTFVNSLSPQSYLFTETWIQNSLAMATFSKHPRSRRARPSRGFLGGFFLSKLLVFSSLVEYL